MRSFSYTEVPLLGAIFLATLLISEEGEYWVNESYTAYSFEQGYENAEGKETDCKFSVFESSSGRLAPLSMFRCGDLDSDTGFLGKYTKARGTYNQLEELRLPKNSSGLYIPVADRQGKKTDNEIMVELIQSGELDNVKVKRATSFEYLSIPLSLEKCVCVQALPIFKDIISLI